MVAAPPPARTSPLVHLAVSPVGETAVVAAASGALWAVDLLEPSAPLAPLGDGARVAATVGALAWNSATGEVLAAGGDGAVRVYKRRHL